MVLDPQPVQHHQLLQKLLLVPANHSGLWLLARLDHPLNQDFPKNRVCQHCLLDQYLPANHCCLCSQAVLEDQADQLGQKDLANLGLLVVLAVLVNPKFQPDRVVQQNLWDLKKY